MKTMRTLMTLALTIFSMTACAIDDTSTEPTARAAIDITEEDLAETPDHCTTNDECATNACDVITRTCVTPEDDDDTLPPRPFTDSEIEREAKQMAPNHFNCNPLVNCYPF